MKNLNYLQGVNINSSYEKDKIESSMITRECYVIPIRIQSQSNMAEHWSKTHKRNKRQKWAIKLMINATRISLPCKVTLTRVAPRMLDDEDNLPAALKSSKDAVADVLVPNLAPGRADGSKDITWVFKQQKGKVREYALIIEMECETHNEVFKL